DGSRLSNAGTQPFKSCERSPAANMRTAPRMPCTYLIVFRDCPASEPQAMFARQQLLAALERYAPRVLELRLCIAAARFSRSGPVRECSLAIGLLGADVHLQEAGDSTARCVQRLARRAARALTRAVGTDPGLAGAAVRPRRS